MFRPEIQNQIDAELARGEQARTDGYEGRARVCARRAVGIAIRAYLAEGGRPAPTQSAYDLIRELQADGALPPEVRQAAGHFLERVNEEHALPEGMDLLAEARWMAGKLATLNSTEEQ